MNPSAFMNEPRIRTAQEAVHPVLAAGVSMIVLQTFFLALRIFARTWVKRIPVGSDDLMLGCSYVINVGIAAAGIVMYSIEIQGNLSEYATFLETPQQIKTQLIPLLKCEYALGPLNFLGVIPPKLSLVLLYLRVFSLNPAFRWATYFVAGIIVLPVTSFSLASFFACKPLNYFWDRTIPNGHCISFNGLYRTAQTMGVVQDVAIFILPLYPLWKLSASTEKKIGLSCVFAVGGVGMVTGIVKLVYFMSYTSEVLEPYITGKLITWVTVECPICGPIYTASAKYLQHASLASAASYVRPGKMANAFGFAKLGGEDHHQHLAAGGGQQDLESSEELRNLPENVVVQTDVNVSHPHGCV
ncbi:MAG: hypothetical protein Q9159_005509 [Coniocarpon cinnabarinum]